MHPLPVCVPYARSGIGGGGVTYTRPDIRGHCPLYLAWFWVLYFDIFSSLWLFVAFLNLSPFVPVSPPSWDGDFTTPVGVNFAVPDSLVALACVG